MAVTVYYDYTCAYSYRGARWLRQVPDIDIHWAPFSLKEANNPAGVPSVFDDDPMSTSVLALVLAGAAKEADFAAYHDAVYDAMHGEGRRLDAGDLRTLAASAGVDLEVFDRDEDHWRRVAHDSHAHGRDHHGVFGTPTLLFDDSASVFLKLTEIPSAAESERLWDSLHVLAVCHPELVEIKRTTSS
jgi:predicted DsbA family dithiol-disulfide isomerase